MVLSATALLSFISVWKAAAFAIAELGVAAFFVAGVAAPLGGFAPWCVLAMVPLSAFVRAMDLESWALFIPRGLVGRARVAFGIRTSRVAAAAVLVERLLLAALAASITAHYGASLAIKALGGTGLTGQLAVEEVVVLLSVVLVGLIWIRTRIDLNPSGDVFAKGVWVGVGLLFGVTAWGVITTLRTAGMSAQVFSPSFGQTDLRTYFATLALVLPVVGGSEVVVQTAHELPPPRVEALRRTSLLVVLFTFVATAIPTFLYAGLVPPEMQPSWADAPLIGLASVLRGGPLAHATISIAVTVAAFLMLEPAARGALAGAEQLVRHLATEAALPEPLAQPHPRFGTFTRAIDITAVSTVLILLVSAGRVDWLAHAYAYAVACVLLIKIAALVRLRRSRPGPRPFVAPFNMRLGDREIPIGLLAAALFLTVGAAGALFSGDPPAVAAAAMLAALATLLIAPGRAAEDDGETDAAAADLLPSADLLLGDVEARPGNVLVTVRNPHALAHVTAAIQAAGDRDVVVMTARLIGLDTDDESSARGDVTPFERRLFTQIAAVGERYNRQIQLLIVPARNVPDAVVATAVRLRSSDVFVGESASLSADEQARLMGEAWERAEKPDALDVRLVIYHHSGRTDAYHLGAHPPAFSAGDLELIHRVWLDAVKAIGRHVHHNDVVRAALTQMEQQLTGPQREDALSAIRRAARPADELAAAVHARDFSRLRDMVRNRHAGDLAAILTQLSVEDQVVAFRVLPPKDAADVFEYLPHEDQEPGRRRRALERDGARRSHQLPRGASRRRDPATAVDADAGTAIRGGHPARLSRKLDRPPHDTPLRGGAGGLDGPPGTRFHPRARTGQRDTERGLCRRSAGIVD